MLRIIWVNFAIQAVTLIGSIVTARVLGPTGRGELALVLLYPNYVAHVWFLGTERAVGIIGGKRELAHPVLILIPLSLIMALPAMMSGYFVVGALVRDPALARLSWIYLFILPAFYFTTYCVYLFNGLGDFANYNKVRSSFYLFNCALLAISFISLPVVSLQWVLALNMVAVAMGALVALRMLWKLNVLSASHDSAAIFRSLCTLLKVALPFVIPLALAQMVASAPQFAIERWMDIKTLGLFAVYFSYARLPSPITSALGTQLFRSGIIGDHSDLAIKLRVSRFLYFVCALPMWLLAGWLLPFIFGEGFAVESLALALLMVSCAFSMSADSVSDFIRAQQKVVQDIWGSAVYLASLVCLIFIVLSLVKTPTFPEIVGALVVADMLRYLCLVWRIRRKGESLIRDYLMFKGTDIRFLFKQGIACMRIFLSYKKA